MSEDNENLGRNKASTEIEAGRDGRALNVSIKELIWDVGPGRASVGWLSQPRTSIVWPHLHIYVSNQANPLTVDISKPLTNNIPVLTPEYAGKKIFIALFTKY